MILLGPEPATRTLAAPLVSSMVRMFRVASVLGTDLRPVERSLQMHLVQNPHQLQISMRQDPRDIVSARTAQIQQLRLTLHRHSAIPLNHRLLAGPGNFSPAAPSPRPSPESHEPCGGPLSGPATFAPESHPGPLAP